MLALLEDGSEYLYAWCDQALGSVIENNNYRLWYRFYRLIIPERHHPVKLMPVRFSCRQGDDLRTLPWRSRFHRDVASPLGNHAADARCAGHPPLVQLRQACAPTASIASLAARLSAAITSAALRAVSWSARPFLTAVERIPRPSGFVRMSASPGLAVLLRTTLSGCTTPVTASPNLGSLSSAVYWFQHRPARTSNTARPSSDPVRWFVPAARSWNLTGLDKRTAM